MRIKVRPLSECVGCESELFPERSKRASAQSWCSESAQHLTLSQYNFAKYPTESRGRDPERLENDVSSDPMSSGLAVEGWD